MRALGRTSDGGHFGHDIRGNSIIIPVIRKFQRVLNVIAPYAKVITRGRPSFCHGGAAGDRDGATSAKRVWRVTVMTDPSATGTAGETPAESRQEGQRTILYPADRQGCALVRSRRHAIIGSPRPRDARPVRGLHQLFCEGI